MSDTGKTKAEIIAAAEEAKAAAYDAHLRKLIDMWMEQIREISKERESRPLVNA